jgi:hypothetical protein
MAKKWEEGIDYSVEIEKAKAAGADTSALEAARAAKIADMYGGVEPTLWGSDKTYTQASKNNDSGAIKNALTTYDKATSGGSSTNKYNNTDYHQNAIDAAIAGDWDAVVDALNNREAKVGATGENYGKTSAQIYAELMNLYGQKTPAAPTAPEFDSQYSTQIDQLLNSILNREEFSYDHTTDPSYLAYEQQYKRLGDRAREDTLGDVAGLTGGYASSWAVSAASQAQNDYNSQLSGIIPQLYDAAYNRYLNEDSLDRNDLGLLMGLDQTDYDRYRDTVSDNQWQQEFDTGKSQWEQTFDWNKTVDQWNMSNTEATQKFDQLMSKWQMTGVADSEVAAGLGVPVGATTESYYFNSASLALDQAKLAQSQKESNKVATETNQLEASIARNAKERINGTESYQAGAEYILSAVTSADEYYRVGSQAGIPTSVLQEVFDSFYNQALNDPGEGSTTEMDYTYYAALMGQQDDPEAWLIANKYSIPSDILEDLSKLLD